MLKTESCQIHDSHRQTPRPSDSVRLGRRRWRTPWFGRSWIFDGGAGVPRAVGPHVEAGGRAGAPASHLVRHQTGGRPNTRFTCARAATTRFSRAFGSTIGVGRWSGSRRRRGWPLASHQQPDLFILGAVPVNFLAKMCHIGADRQWNGAIGVEFVAGADPPSALENRDHTIMRMPVRTAHMTGQPFEHQHVLAGFVRIAIENGGLITSGPIPLPLKLIRQCDADGFGVELLFGGAERARAARGNRQSNSGQHHFRVLHGLLQGPNVWAGRPRHVAGSLTQSRV
jgi:hypothetical protein